MKIGVGREVDEKWRREGWLWIVYFGIFIRCVRVCFFMGNVVFMVLGMGEFIIYIFMFFKC